MICFILFLHKSVTIIFPKSVTFYFPFTTIFILFLVTNIFKLQMGQQKAV